MKRKISEDTVNEWMPLLGAELKWTGNVGHLSFLMSDMSIKKCLVSPNDVADWRGRTYIHRDTAKNMGIKTI